MLRITLLCLFSMVLNLTGCSEYRVYGGVGAHSNNFDGYDWQHENPIGYVRGEANHIFNNGITTGVAISHESIIGENATDGRGLNYIGVHGGYTWGK